MKSHKVHAFVIASLMLCALVGCGKSSENPAPTPKSADQQIKEVQDNPNMPADAKERAIEQIKASQAMNKGAQDTNAKK